MVRSYWLAAIAVVTALTFGLVMAKPVIAENGTPTYLTFTSPPGTTLTQDLLGVIPTPSFTGGVAFAPDGDVLVSECRQGNGDGVLYRFDVQSQVPASDLGFGTGELIHPVTVLGSGLNVGCSLVNHPNGSVYGNSWNGIVRIDPKTGAIAGGPSLGAIAEPFPYNVGKTTSLAVDPLTGDIYYLTNGDGTNGHHLWKVDPGLTSHTLVSDTAFEPYADVDGFYFSPDGARIWAATRDFANAAYAVVSVDRAGAPVASYPLSGAFGEGPDGISFQITTGYVMVNTVAGSFYAIVPSQPASPTNPIQIAPPGSGFRGDLSNVGPDGCVYQTNNLTRFASGLVAANTSLTRICPNFATPPGVTPIDLGLTVSVAPGTYTSGSTVPFTVTASNVGTTTATGAVVSFTVPSGLTGCMQTSGAGVLVGSQWTIGTLAPTVTSVMTLSCTLSDPSAQLLRLRIDGNEQDLQQANNTASASVAGVANSPPVAVDDSASTSPGVPVTVAVLTNDSDPDAGDVITVQSVTQGANGSVTIVGNQVAYAPAPGFTGPTDVFTYTISDGKGGIDTATVTVTIRASNRPPIARDDTAINLWAANPDFEVDTSFWGGTLASVTRVSPPSGAACNTAAARVAFTGGSFYRAYGPVGVLTGNTAGRAVTTGGWVRGEGASVGLSIKVFSNVFGSGSGGELSGTAHVLTADWQWISHTAVIAAADQTAIQAFFQREGDAPIAGEYFYLDGAKAEGGPIATPSGTAVSVDVLVDDCDPDSDPLTLVAVGAAANGVVAIVGNQVQYTPNAGFSGVDTFTYTISDGRGGTDTANVSVTVGAPPNRPPVAVDDSATTTVGTPVTVNVLPNDSDPDGDPLTVTSVGTASNGTVVLEGGLPKYTPAPGFTGVDTFTYTISDGRGGTSTATVTVTVSAAPNRPPVAVDDSATTTVGTPVTVNVLPNDSDPDGDPLTVTSVGTASNGTVVLEGGLPKYTPAPGFTGVDTFTYTISDGRGGTATATVTVTVNAAEDLRRMTGGGNTTIGSGQNAQKVNIGYQLRCRGAGEFELNVRAPGREDDRGAEAFKLDEITSMYCWDDPAVHARVPNVNWDTMTFTGKGRWKNIGGATIRATLVDAGEPARNDTIDVTITDSRGTVVYQGSLRGNNQAHGSGPSTPLPAPASAPSPPPPPAAPTPAPTSTPTRPSVPSATPAPAPTPMPAHSFNRSVADRDERDGYGTTEAQTVKESHADNGQTLMVVNTANSGYYRAWSPVTSLTGPARGKVVRLTAWVRGDAASIGKEVRLYANVWGSPSGGELTFQAFTLTGDWQQIAYTVTVNNEGQTAAQMFVQREGDSPALGEYFHLGRTEISE